MRWQNLISIAAAFLLASCTTNPVPEGYQGPLAHITDSYTVRSGKSADFFYVAKVNGKRIDDSLALTTSVNSGRGFAMSPMVIGRDIPAGVTTTFTIVGRTHYAAPILELMNPVYEISGDVTITPLPQHSYTVKGELDEDHSGVWIEDKPLEVVGQKIEIKGSARLGILQK